jgi:GWxTD domain-containing protein
MGKAEPPAGKGVKKKKLVNFRSMSRSAFIIMTGLVLIVLMGGCSSSEQTTAEESPEYLASLYNPSQLSLHPDYSIYHENERYSVLYIRAYPSELRFNQTNEESEYRALLDIQYRLIQLDKSGTEGILVDSASITYKMLAPDEKRSAFFATLTIPVQQGNQYLLRLRAKDLNLGSVGLKYIYIDKTGPYSAQNFNVVSKFSGYPKFMRFFLSGERFEIKYRDPSVDSMFVDYFRQVSELPRPPITATTDYTLNYTPDTSFVISMDDSAHYNLSRGGMYFIRVTEELEEGLTLHNFGGSFPEVRTPDEMMEPLFYLSTLAEYRDLRTESNRKLAVDNFWLKMGNSVEKSRELIRIYYNRVVYSNLYFTSIKEGWKTDQGMIFILFGPPSRIQMTGNGEMWYYFPRKRGKMVEFRFARQPDVFLNQHLVWMKTTDSQLYWNHAVRSWKNGKVYSIGS